jgi:PAS domain S-box-containing protein
MISLLYVDDDPALLDLCRIFLEQEGDISVVTESSVNDALGRLGTGQFDAIISDYQMPEIDGITFLRKVRQQLPDLPFLLFTGRGREEVVIEAINSGADSYVQKGGDPRSQFKELSHRVRQIVRRRKAETELRLMKFSVDHASEGILWMKVNGAITYYNEAVCTMLGYTPQEFSGLSVSDVRPGLSYYSLSDDWNKLLTQKYATVEEVLVKKDGSLLPVELVLNYNEQGSIIFTYVRDISERRRSEGELKKAFDQLMVTEDGLRHQFEEIKKSDDAIRMIGQRYQMISEEIDAWIWESSLDGCFVSASAQVQDILGYRPDELVGKTFEDFLAPADSVRAASELADLMAKKEAFRSLQLPVVHRDGRQLTLEITGMPVRLRDGSFYGFYGVAREVSSRNSSLAFNNAYLAGYSSLLEQADDAILISDAETGILIDANQKALLLIKRTLPEILTMREYALHSEMGEEHQSDEIPLQFKEESGISEKVIVDRNGKRIPVIVSTKMLQIGEWKLRIGIYHDISDLKAIRETLQEKTSELDRFFTTGPDLLCILDAGGRFLRINPAGKLLLGCDSRTYDKSALMDIVHPDDRAATRTMLQHLVRGGKAVTFVNRITDPNGLYRWIEWRAFMSGRKRIYAVAHDLTEQKKVEQALSVANHKLNLLTDLTRHDIGNKLIILMGYFDLFRNCPDEPYFSMYIEKINETIAAISAQIEFTRIYQNLGISAPRWINVHDLFYNVCRKLDVPSCSISSEQKGWEIFTDPLVNRVFYTFVDNAFRHGTLLTEIRCSIHEISGDLVIVIEDNGIGIVQADKERIFEKEWGKSTGHNHNLFLAREILSITGITIHETGMAGKGARFEMVVPKGSFRIFVPEPGSCSGQVRVPDFISQTHQNHTI